MASKANTKMDELLNIIGILIDKTMDDKLMYIFNDNKQNNPFW